MTMSRRTSMLAPATAIARSARRRPTALALLAHAICWLSVLLGASGSVASAATFTVTILADSGRGSLRQAIDDINNSGPGPHVIAFDLSRFGSGPHIFTPASVYPQINTQVTIDGYTQPGTRPNSLARGSDAVILIEIRGDAAVARACPRLDIPRILQPAFDRALFALGPDAAGSAIRGLAITGAAAPIALFSSGVSVDGNY